MFVLIPKYVTLEPTLSVLVRKHVENLIPRRLFYVKLPCTLLVVSHILPNDLTFSYPYS